MKGKSFPIMAIAVLVGLAATSLAQTSAFDYPQWRGQKRDGEASGFAEPSSWPESLTRRWKVEVGEGYATPLIIGGAAYCFTRRDGNEIMSALDAATGKVVWQTGYPAPSLRAVPPRRMVQVRKRRRRSMTASCSRSVSAASWPRSRLRAAGCCGAPPLQPSRPFSAPLRRRSPRTAVSLLTPAITDR